MSTEQPGVLLMTYGSPASLDREDIRAYLARVRSGREPDPQLVDEFTRRYRVIGGSPLVEITRAQAGAVADSLGWPVEVGMRFSEPSIAVGLRALAHAGVTSVAAIIARGRAQPAAAGALLALLLAAQEERAGEARAERQLHDEVLTMLVAVRKKLGQTGRRRTPEFAIGRFKELENPI